MKTINNHTKYMDYVNHLKSNGYIRNAINLDEKSEIVNIQSLVKGATGTVINIRCPPMYKIGISGKNQVDLLDAHAMCIKLASSDDEDIAPDTRIRLLKVKPSQEITVLAITLYKDITVVEYQKELPNKIKSHDTFYRFDEGIELNGEDHLEVVAINPNVSIDVANVRLSLDIDFFELE